jgi:signal transduction histidine kinase
MLLDEHNATVDRPQGCIRAIAHARFRVAERPATEQSASELAAENARLRSELVARASELRSLRVQAVAAADAERRRIERDLHDGAQNRFVVSTLHLARAKALAGDDSDVAALLETAIAEIATGLGELRDLARGIHPAILTERGLDAGLAALAVRAPLPVDVRGGAGGRLPAPVEAAAYFAASEALQNVAKYAGASHATIAVRHDGERLVVEVTDDGAGGARLDGGSGLRGLVDRLGAVDGRLELTSAPGAGTRVRVEIPCSAPARMA